MIRRALRTLVLPVLLAGVPTPAGVAAAEAPPGALGCSGCHVPAARATAVPPIVGRPAADIAEAMEAFRSGGRAATVMDRIAKGFTREEVGAIAAWLSTQR